jgi:hypothetical protein
MYLSTLIVFMYVFSMVVGRFVCMYVCMSVCMSVFCKRCQNIGEGPALTVCRRLKCTATPIIKLFVRMQAYSSACLCLLGGVCIFLPECEHAYECVVPYCASHLTSMHCPAIYVCLSSPSGLPGGVSIYPDLFLRVLNACVHMHVDILECAFVCG